MKLSQFKYPIPKNLIAKNPKNPRDACKLMVLNRETGELSSHKFKDVLNYMEEGDVLVLNDSKVFNARLFGTKEKTKAKIEVFLLRQLSTEENIWDVVVDPARKVRIGNRIFFTKNLYCEVIDNTTSRGRIVRFNYNGDFSKYIDKLGKTPLPPTLSGKLLIRTRRIIRRYMPSMWGQLPHPQRDFILQRNFSRRLRRRV